LRRLPPHPPPVSFRSCFHLAHLLNISWPQTSRHQSVHPFVNDCLVPRFFCLIDSRSPYEVQGIPVILLLGPPVILPQFSLKRAQLGVTLPFAITRERLLFCALFFLQVFLSTLFGIPEWSLPKFPFLILLLAVCVTPPSPPYPYHRPPHPEKLRGDHFPSLGGPIGIIFSFFFPFFFFYF